MSLEARDNPSGPDLIDPYTVPTPPADPAQTAPPPATPAGNAAGAILGAAATVTPSGDTNTIYNIPLDATLLSSPRG
jgi:hypothetical protein